MTMQIVNVDGNTYRVLIETIKPVRTHDFDCDAWKRQPDGKWHPVRNWRRLDQLARIVIEESCESLSEQSEVSNEQLDVEHKKTPVRVTQEV